MSSSQAWPAPQQAPAPQRVHLRAIAELPTGADERLAKIFRDMRAALGQTVEGVAKLVQATPEVISLLEAGFVRGLPAWPQTQRIVVAYADALRLDPAPLLERIASQMSGAVFVSSDRATATVGHPAVASPATAPTHASRDKPKGPRRQRRREARGRRAFLALSAPMVLLGLGFWLAQAQPGIVMASISVLPAPIAGQIRGGLDRILMWSAPRREGLRWIEVDDPRSRKADRLTVSNR